MSKIDRLMRSLNGRGDVEAVIDRDRTYSYRDLDRRRADWRVTLRERAVAPGEVVGLRADFTFDTVALFLTLVEHRTIVAMVPPEGADERARIRAGELGSLFRFDAEGGWTWERVGASSLNPLIELVRAAGSAGLVVFTSGSTGLPKAVLHDLERFLGKFDRAKKKLRTLAFLPFDHIAGIDTLFYALASGSTLVLSGGRDIRTVCRTVARHGVEVLPVSPTFLNLLCVSGEYVEHDLSSLKIVTFGSEPMTPAVLERTREILPDCRLVQKYGTSEFGSPRSRIRTDGSLWLRLDGEGCEVRVREGLLWVKSESAMLGYLNAPDPSRRDGWICTGDEVVVDGNWMRILGRRSEIINVGGEKVHPAEVENAILEIEGVLEAHVRGESHPLTGSIVTATVRVSRGSEDAEKMASAIRRHCRSRLERHKVPVKVRVVGEPLADARAKKKASPGAGE